MEVLNYCLKKKLENSKCTICGKEFSNGDMMIELSLPLGDDDAVYECDYCLNCGEHMIKQDIHSIKKRIGKLYKILNKIKNYEKH